jgi:hypothetical protein
VKAWIVVLAAAIGVGVAGFVLVGRSTRSQTASVAQVVTSLPGLAGAAVAEANLQSAIASLQSYYAVNGTYAGATVSDAAIRVVTADATGYCIETTVDGQTASDRGPGGPSPGAC